LNAVGVPAESSLVFAVGIAFFLSTVGQMVLGELFPKNLAIARPYAVVRAVSPFSRSFGIVFGPVIRLFDATARLVTTRVFGVTVRDQLDSALNLTELARVITVSGEQGNLSASQTTLLTKAAMLGDRRVSEIMVPRPDVHWLTLGANLAQLRTASQLTGHSRFPVYGNDENDVQGTVHIRALLAAERDAYDTTPIDRFVTPVLFVPESVPLRRLLADFGATQRTAAMVIDEFGSTAGMVTIEDVVEELVGEIEDEFDPKESQISRVGPSRFRLAGSLPVDQLATVLGITVPDGPYETIAGFVLDTLGRIPHVGDTIARDDATFTVSQVDEVRITAIDVTYVSGATASNQ
jgi:CBS domain containing-hemolysin-like protein